MSEGASSGEDRAVVNGAGQAVSALRASVPSAEQIHILRHSLGLTYGEVMYRNHFVTGEGSIDHPHCLALTDAGLMVRQVGSPITRGMDVFFVTEQGKEVALAHCPKLTAAQRRYRKWLDVADVTGQSFGEWLKATAIEARRSTK